MSDRIRRSTAAGLRKPCSGASALRIWLATQGGVPEGEIRLNPLSSRSAAGRMMSQSPAAAADAAVRHIVTAATASGTLSIRRRISAYLGTAAAIPLPLLPDLILLRCSAMQSETSHCTIPAGSVVALRLASTNLEDSETSSVTVTADGKIRPKPHRSFGAGVHRCLGKALARLELSVIVTEWLRAVPHFELERDFALSFTFTQGGAVTPSSLALRWTPAKEAPTT
jgi:Cytochrome P450